MSQDKDLRKTVEEITISMSNVKVPFLRRKQEAGNGRSSASKKAGARRSGIPTTRNGAGGSPAPAGNHPPLAPGRTATSSPTGPGGGIVQGRPAVDDPLSLRVGSEIHSGAGNLPFHRVDQLPGARVRRRPAMT